MITLHGLRPADSAGSMILGLAGKGLTRGKEVAKTVPGAFRLMGGGATIVPGALRLMGGGAMMVPEWCQKLSD